MWGFELEAKIRTQFNVTRSVRCTGCRPERRILYPRIHADPSRMVKGIQKFRLQSEVHLVVNRNEFGDRQIGIDPLRTVQPHQRAKLSSGEVWADVVGAGCA